MLEVMMQEREEDKKRFDDLVIEVENHRKRIDELEHAKEQDEIKIDRIMHEREEDKEMIDRLMKETEDSKDIISSLLVKVEGTGCERKKSPSCNGEDKSRMEVNDKRDVDEDGVSQAGRLIGQ